MSNSDKVDIIGTHISKYSLPETIELFKQTIYSDEKKRVSVVPVNCALWARNNNKLNRLYNSCDVVTADGVPLIWASKLLVNPIRGRVTGLDLLPEFSKVASKEGFTFFFLGAAEGVAERLKEKLETENPGLKVVGT